MDDSNKPLLLQLIVQWLNKIILIVLDQGMILNYRIAFIKKKVMVRDEGAVEWIGVLMLEAK